MNKRVLMRGGAFIASAAFLAASLCEGAAMAASSVELAKNIDDFSFKTVAYKTEATTDGGYIVGGKTIVCVKSPAVILRSSDSKFESDNAFYTIVDLEKCTERIELEGIDITPSASEDSIDEEESDVDIVSADEDLDELDEEESDDEADDEEDDEENSGTEPINMTYLFDELCNPKEKQEPAKYNSKKLAVDEEEPYTYNFQCVDYMAKYTSAGKSVWATPIFDREDILGVGESSTDYRLITVAGSIYVFTKDKGEMSSQHLEDNGGQDIYYNFSDDSDLIINNDGSVVITDDGDILLYNETGDYVREFTPTDGWQYESFSEEISGTVAMSGGKILLLREKEDSTSDLGLKAEIVEVSNNLETVNVRLPAISGSIDSGKISVRYPMGGNQKGDMIVLSVTYDISNGIGDAKPSLRYESYDKNNKLIGTLNQGEDTKKVFMNGYVAYNSANGILGGYGDDVDDLMNGSSVSEATVKPMEAPYDTSKLEFYTRTFEYIGAYTLDKTEDINDYTILNNGTLVAVGATQEENSPNGLRAHLAGKKDVSPANPATFDSVQLIAILGGVAILGTVVLTTKKLARR